MSSTIPMGCRLSQEVLSRQQPSSLTLLHHVLHPLQHLLCQVTASFRLMKGLMLMKPLDINAWQGTIFPYFLASMDAAVIHQ